MSVTSANMRTGLLLVVLCLSCAGCVHHNTSAQRNASFWPYLDAKVADENLWKYLSARSAVLIMAERLDTNFLRTNTFSFRTSSTNHWRGMAVPIDRRGYFLTAAHCLGKGRFWLVYAQDDKVRVEPARIGWRGSGEEGELDLAILGVSRSVSQTFEWAAEFTNGSAVVDLGWNVDSRQLKPQWMAGKVLEVSEAWTKDSLDYTVVTHNSPLRPGDSGGPLALSDGRLLGINVSVDLDFQWSHLSFEKFKHSVAHRPDLAWMRKVIDADAALFSGEISPP